MGDKRRRCSTTISASKHRQPITKNMVANVLSLISESGRKNSVTAMKGRAGEALGSIVAAAKGHDGHEDDYGGESGGQQHGDLVVTPFEAGTMY